MKKYLFLILALFIFTPLFSFAQFTTPIISGSEVSLPGSTNEDANYVYTDFHSRVPCGAISGSRSTYKVFRSSTNFLSWDTSVSGELVSGGPILDCEEFYHSPDESLTQIIYIKPSNKLDSSPRDILITWSNVLAADRVGAVNTAEYYAIFHWNGENFIFKGEEPKGSYIQWIEPVRGSVTTDKTFDIEMEYYISSDEFDESILNKMLIIVDPLNDLVGVNKGKREINFDLIFDSVETKTIEIEMNTSGLHIGLASFWNGVSEDITCKWYQWNCQEEEVIMRLTSTNQFNVESGTYTVDIPFDKQGVMSACEDGNLFTEGLCKSIVYLFYPSSDIGDKFLDITGILGRKVPFGYLGMIHDKIKNVEMVGVAWEEYELDLTTGNDYSLGVIKVFDWDHAKTTIGEENLNTVATWFKNILWIIFGIYLVARIVKITSKI